MLKVLDTNDYLEKLLALPRTGENNILAFYEHRLGAICKNPRLMLMPLDDHMAHRGDGVFETIHAEASRLYQLPAHLARLQKSALGMELTPPCPYSEIQRFILQVAAAGANDHCLIRVLIGRGPGSFGVNPQEAPEASLYIVAYAYQPHAPEFFKKGLSAFRSIYPARDASIAKIKNTNYQTSVAMTREASERGMDVALAFDQAGCLAEAAVANVCLLDQTGSLVVPEFTHALPGTTILRLMELVQKEMPVLVRKVQEQEIYSAQEMMLTGTTVSCVAITSFNGKPIGSGNPGPLAQHLKMLLAKDLEENGIKFK